MTVISSLRRHRQESRKRVEQEWKEINEDPIKCYSQWPKQVITLPNWEVERERLLQVLKECQQDDFITSQIMSKIIYLSWLISDDNFTIKPYHRCDDCVLISRRHFIGSGCTRRMIKENYGGNKNE